MDIKVGIYRQDKKGYPKKSPYLPCCIFEEYPFDDKRTDAANEVYSSLRRLLKLLDLDAENFNTKRWNPLGSIIRPGETVLLKPNLVKHFNEQGDIRSLITHGSLIRAVTDYVYIALKGNGRIIIADGPMDDADFEKVVLISGMDRIRRFYKDTAGFDLEIYDLRRERVIKENEKIIRRIKLKGDPLGYTVVDLGNMSEFKKPNGDRTMSCPYSALRGSECRADIMSLHHNAEKDEYLISNTFLKADVVINLPKMKTHKRSGVTLSLKNLVGVTGDRNWLPHYSDDNCGCGHKTDPGKTFPGIIKNTVKYIKPLRDSLRQFVGVTKETMRSGNWYGNDIIWRTVLDLWRIGSYADKNGVIRKDKQRKSFVIVDGITGGEGDGPLNPRPKKSNVLIAGIDEAVVDIVTSRIMGFDPFKIPLLRRFLPAPDINCVSNVKAWNRKLSDFKGRCLNFKPHYGWKRHIEAGSGVKKQDL